MVHSKGNDNAAVVPVMLVVSLTFPSGAVGTIYQAKLMRDLKFKEVATINAAKIPDNGTVNVTDLGILATNFNRSLPAGNPSLAAGRTTAAGPSC